MEYVNIQGIEIPALGFGTSQLKGSECREAVEHALSLGYRHIDTAQSYANEDDVGAAIERSSVGRGEVFLTTKIRHSELSYEKAGRSIDNSLKKLGLDYVDLLLIHWPNEDVPVESTLKAMKEAQQAGKAKYLGVSNFTLTQLDEASEHAALLCNQVEYHPYLSQDRMLKKCREKEMMLTAYSPLAQGQLAREPAMSDIAEKYNKSHAQLTLRWLIQQENVAAIPKAASAEHREQNLQIFDFELTDEEMRTISNLDRGERTIDPVFAPNWERQRPQPRA